MSDDEEQLAYTGWEFNVLDAERGANAWHNRAERRPLTAAGLEDAMRHMRSLALGDTPAFIRPTYALIPLRWYERLCELATYDCWLALYPELDETRCDHCGRPERFNVLCAACEQLACSDCGRVKCCCCIEVQP